MIAFAGTKISIILAVDHFYVYCYPQPVQSSHTDTAQYSEAKFFGEVSNGFRTGYIDLYLHKNVLTDLSIIQK